MADAKVLPNLQALSRSPSPVQTLPSEAVLDALKLAAALLCSVMLVAAISVHIKKGFFITSGGFEYTLVLGVAALTLAFTGPGSLSLDALLGHYLSGTFWGVAALFVGVLGGVVPLVQRRPVPTQQSATGE